MQRRTGGLIPAQRLSEEASAWRDQGRSIVFTNGCFDLLHPGHLALLETAAELGDILIVAINDDGSVRRLKGGTRPVYPASERAELLLALRWVDAVTIYAEDTPIETIRRVRPHVLVKGAEYGSGAVVGEDFVLASGGRVVRAPMRTGYSTSDVVRRMMSAGDAAGSEEKS